MSLEILKKLTPNSPQFGTTGGGHKNSLSSLDVAAALAYTGIDELARSWVEIKYQKSTEEQIQVIESRVINDILLVECVRQLVNWPVDKMIYLCDIAIRAELLPNKCHMCNGVGHINAIECSECLGTGNIKESDTAKGKRLGMSSTAYKKTWHDREMELRLVLQGWENEADYRLNKTLR